MNFQFRLVAEGFTVLGAIIYLVLEIKDVLITQGITAQLITLVSLLSYARLPIILVSNLPRGRAPGFLEVRARGVSYETVLRPPK